MMFLLAAGKIYSGQTGKYFNYFIWDIDFCAASLHIAVFRNITLTLHKDLLFLHKVGTTVHHSTSHIYTACYVHTLY
jgi:hypothetical protein